MLEIVKYFGRPGGEVVVTVEAPVYYPVAGVIKCALVDARPDILDHAIDKHGLIAITVRVKLAGMFYGYRVRFTPSMLSYADELAALLGAGLRDEVRGLSETLTPEAWAAVAKEAFPA